MRWLNHYNDACMYNNACVQTRSACSQGPLSMLWTCHDNAAASLLPLKKHTSLRCFSHDALPVLTQQSRDHGMRASWQVRRAFLDMLGAWLLELPDRDEHRARLLPYLLAALADPVPALAAAAAAALEALGAQYERDHAAELKACYKTIFLSRMTQRT